MLDGIALGFQHLMNPMVLLALLGGVMLGMVVGSLPGLNDSITIAVLIPVTFGMDAYVALALLCGIYVSSACGGSFPAILMNIPGTASAMVTTLDGYPMKQQGKGGLALGIANTSSFFGGLFSSLCLLLFAPILAQVAVKFGPPEYFMLGVLGLATVIGMSTKNVTKALLSMAIGLWLSTIGMSPQTGIARYTFGQVSLLDGIPLIPRMIGLFGITSVLKMVDEKRKVAATVSKSEATVPGEVLQEKVSETETKLQQEDVVKLPDKEMALRLLPTWISSSFIGTILGIIPGAGMTMAIYVAYDQVQKVKKKLKFGTGVPEGVAAPEAANNAVVAGSMVPLLSLGIPGNGTSALFLGALTIQGMRTGPTLFTENGGMAYMMILAFVIGNLIMFPLGYQYCKHVMMKVLKIRSEILAAGIIVLCLTGSFAYKNNPFHVLAAVFFGLVGYLFWKYKIPQAPLILSTIVGSMMESNWLSSMVYADGSVSVFFTRPISLGLVIVSVLFLIWPIIQKIRQRKQET